MKPGFQIYIKVQRPIRQVFDAVYNPRKLMKYFTTKSASAPMKGGTTVMWDFADFPGAFPVYIKKSVLNKQLVFEWQAQDGPYNTRVKMEFKKLGPRNTQVVVSESGWKNTPKGRANSYGNCMGWTQMICCLKAYLEYGINLRKGAF
jgi:uncharacterized protein YndB with AHSA1/START domain